MNAPFDPNREAKLLVLDILTGKTTQPFGIGGVYSADEWKRTAQFCADMTDYSEIIDMIADERKHEARPGCLWGDAA